MPYSSKDDQANGSRRWYLENKALVLERKANRQYIKGACKYSKFSFRYQRINWALERISRDRWISPKELAQITEKLCACLFLDPGRAVDAVFSKHPGCLALGMLRGRVPFDPMTLKAAKFEEVVKRKRRANSPPIELEILKIALERN